MVKTVYQLRYATNNNMANSLYDSYELAEKEAIRMKKQGHVGSISIRKIETTYTELAYINKDFNNQVIINKAN